MNTDSGAYTVIVCLNDDFEVKVTAIIPGKVWPVDIDVGFYAGWFIAPSAAAASTLALNHFERELHQHDGMDYWRDCDAERNL